MGRFPLLAELAGIGPTVSCPGSMRASAWATFRLPEGVCVCVWMAGPGDPSLMAALPGLIGLRIGVGKRGP